MIENYMLRERTYYDDCSICEGQGRITIYGREDLLRVIEYLHGMFDYRLRDLKNAVRECKQHDYITCPGCNGRGEVERVETY